MWSVILLWTVQMGESHLSMIKSDFNHGSISEAVEASEAWFHALTHAGKETGTFYMITQTDRNWMWTIQTGDRVYAWDCSTLLHSWIVCKVRVHCTWIGTCKSVKCGVHCSVACIIHVVYPAGYGWVIKLNRSLGICLDGNDGFLNLQEGKTDTASFMKIHRQMNP